MKQLTKKAATILIIVVMILSVFGYAAVFLYRGLTQKQGQQEISYVMKQKLNNEIKSYLIDNGITILEVYYGDNIDPKLLYSIEALPTEYTTLTGNIQIVISEIYEKNRSDVKVSIQSMNGKEEVEPKTFDDIKGPLCSLLTVTPVECLNVTE